MNAFKTIYWLALLTITLTGYGQSSVLSTGKWFKVAVEKNGIYKITYDQFKQMGFDPATIDPRKIRVHGQEGGMVPQPNNIVRPLDLPELAIFVSGENDGIFNPGDYLLFYAQGPDRIAYHITRQVIRYEANLYSEQNFYFITVASDNGKRVASSPDIGNATITVDQYDDFVYHETDEYNELESGREWFGERFELTTEHTFTFDIPGIIDNTEIKMVSDVMAQSYTGSSFKLSFNNSLIAEQAVPAIPESQYSLKGRHRRDTITMSTTEVSASSTAQQRIRYQYIRATTGRSIGFLDFFLLSYKRKLALYNDQTIFRSSLSLSAPAARYIVNGITTGNSIWDVSNPYEPKIQAFAIEGNNATFATASEPLKEFIAFNGNIPAPAFIGNVDNQNLRGLSVPNLVIITHPDFLAQAQKLAAHRTTYSGWSVAIVTPEQVFNEFSSGRQDVSAIRDFMKHLYNKSPETLKALLLFGRGSYDYKDRVSNNTNFVPTYESRNSLAPLETYSSDDYFGFLEDHEGLWNEETPILAHTLDIGVGRLPVKSGEEADAIVNKIIDYTLNKKALGKWRKDIVFVADDGSLSDTFSSVHQSQANTMANKIENTQAQFNTRKIFLGTYKKTVAPNGETIPEAKKDIVEDFERGTLIMNYTGHGAEKLWADEKIFTDQDIEALENKLYPFLVTATCEFGRQDNPTEISSAELSVIKPNGGSIGLVTTARPVNSNTNFDLNQAFYEALFEKESNHYLSLGEVFRRTKNNSVSGVANRNFSLLADPSLTLAMPALLMAVDEIQTTNGSDTLKALSTVVVKGHVQNSDGSAATTFNGTLEATLFDKQTDFVTIGRNNPSFSFSQWYNALFRGKASVKAGYFEFRFIVPKNIDYAVGFGKLSLYAADPVHLVDASGAATDFKIGQSENTFTADGTSPQIRLFIGDTTFVNGGLASANTTLVARITDDSGINISNYGIGNTMVAILDNDEQVYVVNEYYTADADDYSKGWLNFPLKDLPAGRHTLTLKVWDVHNNPAETSIDFIVTDGEILQIETFANYPNPFQYETTLYFTHNRSGDDLRVQLYLYNLAGQQLKTYNLDIFQSSYQVNVLELNGLTDFGKKLPGGVYFARLVVRSLSNGSKSERVTKLIIVN